MASSAVEEYLQAIYTLADENGHVVSARLAEFLGFSAPAVSEMVDRMERDGLVSLDGHKEVHLTTPGKIQADSIVLGFEWWKTHEEAEWLEHAMSPEMEARMITVLGDPQTCPHGSPMPGVTLELVEVGPAVLRVQVDGAVRSLRPDCGQKVWMAA
jgi:DtxR family Mn-dependent transcriptional regulator